MRYQGPWDRFITLIWSHEESRICRALCWIDIKLSHMGDDISDWWDYWPNQVMVSLTIAALCFALGGMGIIWLLFAAS